MDSHWIETVQQEFADLKDVHYLNSAYFGPTPARSKQLVAKALAREFNPSFHPYEDWIHRHDDLRNKLAQLLELPSELLSMGTSVTDFVQLLAWHLAPPAGARVAAPSQLRVLTFEGEYPSNVLPWLSVRPEQRPLPLEVLRAPAPSNDQINNSAYWDDLITTYRPQVINLSWVAFDTGRLIPLQNLKYLKEKYQVFIILDATQGLGARWPSGREVQEAADVLLCSTYKWMLGPYGQAFGYFSPRALAWLNLTSGNWISGPSAKNVNCLTQYQLATMEEAKAKSLDRGQGPNLLANACLEGALDFYLAIGTKAVQQYVSDLVAYFQQLFTQGGLEQYYQLLTPQSAECRAGIIALKQRQHERPINEMLKNNNIDISIREGKLRISLHVFNRKDQVAQLIEVLGSIRL